MEALDLDPNTARSLFEQGAFLLFLSPPKNLEFGIDLQSWTVGPLFLGMKMIPPGIHFIYYRLLQ
jgi:A1 cistron-splicing factor AAR2